jgi:putative ABC transport system permease protein
MLLSSLLRRRSRLLVALLGVALGAAVLLGLVTLCYDIPRQMSREFRSYGANMVFVKKGGAGRLQAEDLRKVEAALSKDAVVGLSPFRYESVRSRMLPYTAVGAVFADAQKTSPYWRINGEYPRNDSEILIGEDVSAATGLGVGSPMPIDGRNSSAERYEREMTISGVVATGGVEDGFVFMNLSAMEDMTGETGALDLIEGSLALGGEDLAAAAADLRAALPEIDARLVARVTSPEERVLSKLAALVYLVTAVVLSLTMICVATTMMTVVIERRREIGLKKALGAGAGRVAGEFLAEGLILGVAGGLLGSLGGLIFARLVSQSVFGRPLDWEFHLVPLTILVSALVTVLASLIPVSRAAEAEPALVLRGE